MTIQVHCKSSTFYRSMAMLVLEFSLNEKCFIHVTEGVSSIKLCKTELYMYVK